MDKLAIIQLMILYSRFRIWIIVPDRWFMFCFFKMVVSKVVPEIVGKSRYSNPYLEQPPSPSISPCGNRGPLRNKTKITGFFLKQLHS